MMNVNMFKSGDSLVEAKGPSLDELPPVEELPLPPNFAWGAATAAYQIEGGASQDGKGKSIWDTFSHLEPSRTNGENGDVACDHYNRVVEDVKLMASYGMEVYRFSIAWTRIIPLGGRRDPVNEQGISFYNNLIDQLLSHHIEPVVTLYHWDCPQVIYDRYGAFLNKEEFQADFEHYARICFSRFGDRVKKWESQKGEISIVLNGHFYEPWDPSSDLHIEAAQRRLEFYIGWFGDPIFLGQDYPETMKIRLGDRLPRFTTGEFELLRKLAPHNAFYGMNHYSTKYARALPGPPADDDCTGNVEEGSIDCQGNEIGPASGMPWLRVAPVGFRKVLNWVWNRYHVPIIITENGCPCPGESRMTLGQALDDKFRVRYIGLYLDAISRAINEDGVEVLGYYVWSLMDNFGTLNIFQFVLSF
ncbi:hypothetical protein TCE0_060r18631 [Talaromyces pinophilus]|uniref:Beta-glucosidase n=1 Tax=Talaromyces pinophilus TaxID=128442 RepID=A0A6V8HTA0_TALPI|nr:hypothetical protein TCE0_060r18631 [Talaromyces pinophilus]